MKMVMVEFTCSAMISPYLRCNLCSFNVGNFLVSKEPPNSPILLDFGLTKSLSSSMKQALAKMFLACAEVRIATFHYEINSLRNVIAQFDHTISMWYQSQVDPYDKWHDLTIQQMHHV